MSPIFPDLGYFLSFPLSLRHSAYKPSKRSDERSYYYYTLDTLVGWMPSERGKRSSKRSSKRDARRRAPTSIAPPLRNFNHQHTLVQQKIFLACENTICLSYVSHVLLVAISRWKISNIQCTNDRQLFYTYLLHKVVGISLEVAPQNLMEKQNVCTYNILALSCTHSTSAVVNYHKT